MKQNRSMRYNLNQYFNHLSICSNAHAMATRFEWKTVTVSYKKTDWILAISTAKSRKFLKTVVRPTLELLSTREMHNIENHFIKQHWNSFVENFNEGKKTFLISFMINWTWTESISNKSERMNDFYCHFKSCMFFLHLYGCRYNHVYNVVFCDSLK